VTRPSDDARHIAGKRCLVTASPDGARAAVVEPDRVVVVELAGARTVSEIGLATAEADTDVAWVGAGLLVLARHPGHSTVHLIDVDGPRLRAEIRIERAMRIAATLGAQALVLGDAGAAVLTAGEAQLTAFLFPSRARPSAAGTAGAEFVVAVPGGIEEWDPQRRVPRNRMRLARQPTVLQLGGSERLVWMTTQQEPARIDVIPRLARAQPRAYELPEPIARVSGHPRRDVLACVGGETGRLYVVELEGKAGPRTVAVPGLARVDVAALFVGDAVGVVAARAGHALGVAVLEGKLAGAPGRLLLPGADPVRLAPARGAAARDALAADAPAVEALAAEATASEEASAGSEAPASAARVEAPAAAARVEAPASAARVEVPAAGARVEAPAAARVEAPAAAARVEVPAVAALAAPRSSTTSAAPPAPSPEATAMTATLAAAKPRIASAAPSADAAPKPNPAPASAMPTAATSSSESTADAPVAPKSTPVETKPAWSKAGWAKAAWASTASAEPASRTDGDANAAAPTASGAGTASAAQTAGAAGTASGAEQIAFTVISGGNARETRGQRPTPTSRSRFQRPALPAAHRLVLERTVAATRASWVARPAPPEPPAVVPAREPGMPRPARAVSRPPRPSPAYASAEISLGAPRTTAPPARAVRPPLPPLTYVAAAEISLGASPPSSWRVARPPLPALRQLASTEIRFGRGSIAARGRRPSRAARLAAPRLDSNAPPLARHPRWSAGSSATARRIVLGAEGGPAARDRSSRAPEAAPDLASRAGVADGAEGGPAASDLAASALVPDVAGIAAAPGPDGAPPTTETDVAPDPGPRAPADEPIVLAASEVGAAFATLSVTELAITSDDDAPALTPAPLAVAHDFSTDLAFDDAAADEPAPTWAPDEPALDEPAPDDATVIAASDAFATAPVELLSGDVPADSATYTSPPAPPPRPPRVISPRALAALAPHTPRPRCSPEENDRLLDRYRRYVADTALLSIAQDWDRGRLSFATADRPVFETEVFGILGRRAGLAPAQMREALAAREEAAGELQRAWAALAGRHSPLDTLCAEYGISRTGELVLMFAAAPSLWGELARLYRILTHDAGRAPCDEHLLWQLLGQNTSRADIARELDPEGPLRYHGLIHASDRNRPFQQVTVHPTVVKLLLGAIVDEDLPRGVARVPARVALDDLMIPDAVLADALAELATAPAGRARLVVTGRSGSGRRTLLATLAARAGRTLATIDAAMLIREQRLPALASLLQQAHLSGWLPCVDGLETIPSDDGAARGTVRDLLRDHPGPLAVRLPRHVQPPLAPGYVPIELPTSTVAQRAEQWSAMLATSRLTVRDIDALAARFTIGPGTIHRVVASVARTAPASADHALESSLRQYLETKLGAVANRVTRLASWSQIVLPEEIRDSIIELVARIRHRRTVYDTWGFEKVMSTSRGLTALFEGGPGTGKTLVASAIANELGLDLYRVDLSRVMSKWIGETEQNLGKVFDAAEEGQALLLFDEADSLFGKRTEVRTSVDRYANLETNYLLQRLDTFEGVAVLTTNFGTAIDAAFKRRLSSRLTFPFPDEAAREALWRIHLPERIPRAGALDLAALAARYKMSGGYIRNAALRAAFLAAEEDTPLSQDHLERAVRAEFREGGKLAESGSLE
jgi:hypothetical protein